VDDDARKFRPPVASSLVVLKDYEIRSGERAVTIRSAPSAQQALLDYVKSLGCRDSEIVRLGQAAVSWRGARYTAVPAVNAE
jgi:hypothetical protein